MNQQKSVSNGRGSPADSGFCKLDDADRRIMAMLRHNGRLAYAEIARTVSLSEPTVRLRVDRLVQAGAISIKGWINPTPLGFPVDAWVGVRVDSGRITEVARRLAAVENVAYVAYVTGSFDVMIEAFLPDTEGLFRFLSEGLEGIDGISRTRTWSVLRTEKFFYNLKGEDVGVRPSSLEPMALSPGDEISVSQGSRPHGNVRLDDVDRHIVKALRHDGRLTCVDIAREEGLSVATARRRLNRLVHTGVISIMARVDPPAIGFPVSAYVGIRVAKGQIRNVGRRLAQKETVAYLAYIAGSFDIVVQAYLPTADGLLEFLDGDLAEIDGITHTETWHVLRTEKFFYNWQGEDVGARLGSPTRTRSRSRPDCNGIDPPEVEAAD